MTQNIDVGPLTIVFSLTGEGETYQETAWVDHFQTKWTEINDLEPDTTYEFKTIGRNKVGPSPESDVTQASLTDARAPVAGETLKSSCRH